MLTLISSDKETTKIVSIYSNVNKKKRRPVATVYFTHDVKSVEKQNVAPAAGVLALHKKGLKKINRITEAEFEQIATMLDEEEEPDGSLRSAYWNIKPIFDRALRREMYLSLIHI